MGLGLILDDAAGGGYLSGSVVGLSRSPMSQPSDRGRFRQILTKIGDGTNRHLVVELEDSGFKANWYLVSSQYSTMCLS